MARDSSGTQNQPQYSGTGASADAADLTELGTYAALVGNRKIGTTSQRNTASGADVWDGLLWGDTTDGFEYKRVAGAWVAVFKPGNQPFAMASGSGSNTTGSYATITFPVGRFTVPPIITATTYGTFVATANIGTVTTTTAQIAGFAGSSATASSWYWSAVQMTATTAAG